MAPFLWKGGPVVVVLQGKGYCGAWGFLLFNYDRWIPPTHALSPTPTRFPVTTGRLEVKHEAWCVEARAVAESSTGWSR